MEIEQINAQRNGPINWATSITMVIFHLGAIAALFMFTWKALFVTLFLWWVSGSLGIGMGYHRLLTHRGFKTPKFVEYFLTVCATLTLEGGPIHWIATHRIHHAHTDIPATRIARATAPGGHIWAGFSRARRNSTMKRRCGVTRPIS
jgi:fatty-acid desaturase